MLHNTYPGIASPGQSQVTVLTYMNKNPRTGCILQPVKTKTITNFNTAGLPCRYIKKLPGKNSRFVLIFYCSCITHFYIFAFTVQIIILTPGQYEFIVCQFLYSVINCVNFFV